MTKEKFIEIGNSYGFSVVPVPLKHILDNMTETQCHAFMKKLCKAFDEIGKEKGE